MGVNYFGARYYDADIGLWTSVDPMRQFWSGYSYGGNGFNPINSTDPDGMLQRADDYKGEMTADDWYASKGPSDEQIKRMNLFQLDDTWLQINSMNLSEKGFTGGTAGLNVTFMSEHKLDGFFVDATVAQGTKAQMSVDWASHSFSGILDTPVQATILGFIPFSSKSFSGGFPRGTLPNFQYAKGLFNQNKFQNINFPQGKLHFGYGPVQYSNDENTRVPIINKRNGR